MIRYIFFIFTIFLTVPMTYAQTSKKNRLSGYCDGKYSEAAASIDEANRLFGSLYSGGSHFRTYSTDLRATINLYREIQGLKPLDFGRYSYEPFILGDYKPTASALTRALRMMTWSDPEMNASELQNNIILLDVLTSKGPADDWWLRVDDFKISPADAPSTRGMPRDEAIEYAKTYITAAQRIVADLTQRHDELDWLQAALILSSYEHPWQSAGGKSAPPNLASLFEHIEKKSLGGDDYRAWLALLSHHKFYDREIPTEIRKIQNKMASDIENCSASPTDYAALVAGNYLLSDQAMSSDHLDLNLEIEARKITFETQGRPVFDAQYHAIISALKERAYDKRKYALPLMLSAPDLQAVESAFHLNPDVTRPLNILSGHDLENISLGAAFTRHVAMERPADARRVLDKALAVRPELDAAIEDILVDDLSLDIQMIMVTLRLRCLSHYMSDFCTLDELAKMEPVHRDIDKNYESGKFIQTEIMAWAFPENAPWTPSRYYLQNGLGETIYSPIHNRRRNLQRTVKLPYSKKKIVNDIDPSFEEMSIKAIEEYKKGLRQCSGLMALADWTEFEAITGERRLTRALSLDVIIWVRTAPDDPIMAEALHRVVRLNKHESGGKIDNQPVAKVAFELLHKKFPNSEWTKRTPVWWPPREH